MIVTRTLTIETEGSGDSMDKITAASVAALAMTDTLNDDRIESLSLDSEEDRRTLAQIFWENLHRGLHQTEER